MNDEALKKYKLTTADILISDTFMCVIYVLILSSGICKVSLNLTTFVTVDTRELLMQNSHVRMCL